MSIPPDDYDDSYFTRNGQDRDRWALRLYVKLLTRYTSGPFLDWGCGSGFLLRRLARIDRAIGLDPSPYAMRRASEVSPNAHCVASSDGIRSGFVGGISAIHVMEHLSDQQIEAVITEWRRILKPTGAVLIATPDLNGEGRRLSGDKWIGFSDPTHINLKGAQDWVDIMTEAGFSPLCQGSDGLWNGPYRSGLRVEALLHQVPCALAVLSGRLVSRVGRGESYVAVWAPRE